MKDVIALQAFLDREAAARGVSAGAPVFQSHPLSDARVAVTEAALARAARIAAAAPPAGEGRILQHRASWLSLLDDLRVETDAFGVVRGGRFGWPAQGFRINAPKGMTLAATVDGVVGGGGEDGRLLYLDADRADLFVDTETALDDLRLRLAAARAEAVFGQDARAVRIGAWPGLRVDIPPGESDEAGWLSLVAVQGPEGPIRLIYGGKGRDKRAHFRAMRRLLRTLRPLSTRDAEAFAPLRLAVAPLAEVILNPRESEPTRQWAIKTLLVTLPKTHDVVVQTLIKASQDKSNYGVSQLARQQVRSIDLEAAEEAGVK